MANIEIGKFIEVDHKLVRKKCFHGDVHRKQWVKQKIKKTTVCVVGIRYLFNGKISCGYDYKQFHCEESVSALLVCESLRKNPFYVLRDEPLDVE